MDLLNFLVKMRFLCERGEFCVNLSSIEQKKYFCHVKSLRTELLVPKIWTMPKTKLN
jgi:hypothetical protein